MYVYVCIEREYVLEIECVLEVQKKSVSYIVLSNQFEKCVCAYVCVSKEKVFSKETVSQIVCIERECVLEREKGNVSYIVWSDQFVCVHTYVCIKGECVLARECVPNYVFNQFGK